ncbi:hypothetical protein IWW37_002967 [Coemansia sp. RSA 2050]|nr:hypothetical protein IWW37_002967 [Coemansia sp. RSA 2050]KAJ2732541.1 hypothetical protein IW152_003748 [Coemansia sp. BCRC 34962]
MEVLDRQEALVSNYEVLIVLQEEDQRHKKIKPTSHAKYPENVSTLKFEALQYLNGTACSTQSAAQIAALKSGLADYDLTKAEVLQIINLRPRKPVELYLIIEECEERFDETTIEEIMRAILSALPRDDDDEEGEEDGDEEAQSEGEMDVDQDHS